MEEFGLPVPGVALVAFGGWSLFIGLIWFGARQIANGKWHHESTVQILLADKDITVEDLRQRLADKTAEADTYRQQRDVMADEVSQTMVKVLRALPAPDQEASR